MGIPTITKRQRRRVLKNTTVVQTRYVVNATDAVTGKRKQFFFERLRDAQIKRDSLIRHASTERPAAPKADDGTPPLVRDVVAYWLDALDPGLKASTRAHYHCTANYIVRPLYVGTAVQRRVWARTGMVPAGIEAIPMLADVPLEKLTTGQIRAWHKVLVMHVGAHTANVAKKILGAALARVAEDLSWRVPPMPAMLGSGRTRPKKTILTPAQVGQLLRAAAEDSERGLYYAFPFLTGVRPSEQLGLKWKDIDFDNRLIHVCRMQEMDGSLCELTKTPAGNRFLPMSPLLFDLLSRWRTRWPGEPSPEARVFLTLGTPGSKRHCDVGRPLTYANFRNSYWRPALKALGLPYVSPHSARHTFISTLQANGIEVGLVAKLAGHANATITLAHYTQAVRGGESALNALEASYVR